jgi:hypothetical protein
MTDIQLLQQRLLESERARMEAERQLKEARDLLAQQASIINEPPSIAVAIPIGEPQDDFIFYPNHIKAGGEMRDVLVDTDKGNYVVLKSQMQSGKTGSYLYLALEMMRLGVVVNVVIICGTTDKALRDQAIKDKNDAIATYACQHNIHIGRFKSINVLFSQDLPKDTETFPKGTLVIHEESHWGQSIGQRPNNYLLSKGLPNITAGDPEGLLKGLEIFYVSVSATPFSELINIAVQREDETLEQKEVIVLEPPAQYKGIPHYNANGKILPTFDLKTEGGKRQLKTLIECMGNTYGLLRAVGKTRGRVLEVLQSMDIKPIDYDQHYDGRINEILREKPTSPSIILLKNRLRMGEVIYKLNISWVYEGATYSKTDTVLQSLAGRVCGIPCPKNPFPKEDITIYVPNTSRGDMESYGVDAEGLPKNGAMNVKKVSQRVRKVAYGNDGVPISVHKWIPREIYRLQIDTPKDVLTYLFQTYPMGEGPWANVTEEQYMELLGKKAPNSVSKRDLETDSLVKFQIRQRLERAEREKLAFGAHSYKEVLKWTFWGSKRGSHWDFDWITIPTIAEDTHLREGERRKVVGSLPETTGKEIYTIQTIPDVGIFNERQSITRRSNVQVSSTNHNQCSANVWKGGNGSRCQYVGMIDCTDWEGKCVKVCKGHKNAIDNAMKKYNNWDRSMGHIAGWHDDPNWRKVHDNNKTNIRKDFVGKTRKRNCIVASYSREEVKTITSTSQTMVVSI